MSEVKLNHLTTERRNEKTMNLDTLSTRELLQIMNEEDHKVPEAVKEAIPQIEAAVKAIIASSPNFLANRNSRAVLRPARGEQSEKLM